jgi:hypothetical protein
MTYDIAMLLDRHKACLNEIASHFEQFFNDADYLQKQKGKIKKHVVKLHTDLDKVLRGAGFYLIATDYPTGTNPCTLKIADGLPVVYRGHSYNVRERVESHLFYDQYRIKDSGRRFTVCMKLDGGNINIDKSPLNGKQWMVVTHSMTKSTSLIRQAAEIGFDNVFGRPVGSDR